MPNDSLVCRDALAGPSKLSRLLRHQRLVTGLQALVVVLPPVHLPPCLDLVCPECAQNPAHSYPCRI